MVIMDYEKNGDVDIDKLMISLTLLSEFIEISPPIIFNYLEIRFRLWDYLLAKYMDKDKI